MDVVELVNKYGFPIVMAVEVKPVIGEANTVLIALIDRIRMLDNDLIRLNQKVNTVLHLRGKMIESDRVMEGVKVEREAAKTFDAAVRMDDPKPDLKDEEDINKKDETNKVRSIRYENNDDKGKN